MPLTRATTFAYEFDVSWGDCDPARIVFYPRYFQWIDARSHKLMAAAGMGQRHAAGNSELLVRRSYPQNATFNGRSPLVTH